jgi:hypothetical protein
VVYLRKLTVCSKTDVYPGSRSRAAALTGKSPGSGHSHDFLQLRFVDPRVIEIVASLNVVYRPSVFALTDLILRSVGHFS